MRYSKDHKTETHARIVENASVLLREKGAEGIGVAALMKEAGLTHGGFYAHFESRDALIAEAFAHAMDETMIKWRKRAEGAAEGERLAAIVNGYLTRTHRDNVGNGCALPAIGAEVPRASLKTRKEAAAKVDDMIKMVAQQISGLTPKVAKKQAISSLSTMLGTLVLARMAGTGDLSDEILEAGREAALAIETKPKPRRAKKTSK
jgi:TetR/AcrR family transcriptional repressor of nem operon